MLRYHGCLILWKVYCAWSIPVLYDQPTNNGTITPAYGLVETSIAESALHIFLGAVIKYNFRESHL